MLPLAVPGLVMAFGFVAVLRQMGGLGHYIAETAPIYVLVTAYAVRRMPYLVRSAAGGLQQTSVTLEEAAANLGATGWQYWRYVGLPLLAPAFLGALLLLFANAFAAYATAAALVSQGSPIIPLWIRTALTSEVVLGRQNFAYALALEMIVVVAAVMIGYTLLVRRTARWIR